MRTLSWTPLAHHSKRYKVICMEEKKSSVVHTYPLEKERNWFPIKGPIEAGHQGPNRGHQSAWNEDISIVAGLCRTLFSLLWVVHSRNHQNQRQKQKRETCVLGYLVMGGPPKCLWLWSSCQPRHLKFVIKAARHVRMNGELVCLRHLVVSTRERWALFWVVLKHLWCEK